MFHEAAQYVKTELQRLGFTDANIEQYVADGKTKYWTFTSPMGWEAKSAQLRLIEPEEKLLCDYEDTPQSLHTYSKGTKPEGVIAELIDVGVGTSAKDYEGKNVKGKFVLATGRARAAHRIAVQKKGALAVLTDAPIEMPNVREGIDIPDAHAYQGIWPAAEDASTTTFGFSITKRQGNMLRARLSAGKKVKLKATVDARLFSFFEDVVTATIKGVDNPTEEIFLVAHLCHPKPSANDNASGSACLLEIARTLKKLIEIHKMPAPSRSIRFLWVPETLGTTAYLARHNDASTRLIAGINLDMVGQNQELCKSTLTLDRTPDSLPSFLNDYVYRIIEQTVDEFDYETHFGTGSIFRYRTSTFSGGSDHAEFTNSTTGVPCVMLLQWPDLYYHTSQDTIDKVSPESLKRVAWITATAALTLARSNHELLLTLAHQTAAKGRARIADVGRETIEAITKEKEDSKPRKTRARLAFEIAEVVASYRSKINHAVWREKEAVRSVQRLGHHCELDSLLDKYCQDITRMGRTELTRLDEAVEFIAKSSGFDLPLIKQSKAEKELQKLTLKRLFKGSLDSDSFRKALGDETYQWYEKIDQEDKDFSKKMMEIINFMDGKNNGTDISKAVSSEYSPTKPEHVLRFLQDLVRAKLAKGA